MEENAQGMEFCAATVQHLAGKRLRRRILTQEDNAVCEICGKPMSGCGCKASAALFEPDSGSWVCDNCFGVFKDLLQLETE